MRLALFIYSILLFVTACAPNPASNTNMAPLTEQERYTLANPPAAFLRDVDVALPAAVAELRRAERLALDNGRSLTNFETRLARQVGVRRPEKIRIYFTDNFPVESYAASGNGQIVALAMNYGLYIHPMLTRDKDAYYEVLAHEFYHVVQFETLGVEGAARRFLIERNLLPHKLIPLEREAIYYGNKAYDDPKTVYGG